MSPKIAPPVFSGPLKSWDIFIENYHRLVQKGEDLKAIQKIAISGGWQCEWDLQKELVTNDAVIIITDIYKKIIFATGNIVEMTGYAAKELKGKDPKIFQGKGTPEAAIAYITEMIMVKKPFEITIVNYKKNGLPYNCHIKGYPVFNDHRQLVNFIAFEKAA